MGVYVCEYSMSSRLIYVTTASAANGVMKCLITHWHRAMDAAWNILLESCFQFLFHCFLLDSYDIPYILLQQKVSLGAHSTAPHSQSNQFVFRNHGLGCKTFDSHNKISHFPSPRTNILINSQELL